MAKGIKLRNWALDIRDFETDDQFRAAVELELARLENFGERLGIGFVVAPMKQVIAGEYVTAGWTFQSVTIPAAREATPEPEVEPLTEEERLDLDEAAEEEAVAAISDDPYAEN